MPSWGWASVLGVIGLIIQFGLGMFFLGKMRNEVTNVIDKAEALEKHFDKVIERVDAKLDLLTGLAPRVTMNETQIAQLLLMRDAFNVMMGAQDVHNTTTKDALEKIQRSQEQGARSFGSLLGLLRKDGFTLPPGEDR